MPINVTEAVDFVKDIARNEQVKVSVTRAVQGGLAVGCVATAGALLLGPVGLAIGGAVGGIGAAVAMRDRFVPLPEAIANMSSEQKQALADKVQRIANNLDVTDIAALGLMVAGNSALRGRVVQELIGFINQEVQVAIA